MEKEAEKKIVSEEDIIKSNKMSFGDAIGSTTNVITSQICIQAKFEPDSEEYKQLQYRVLCGQLYQQGCIDRAKGIISKPMPKYWYDLTPLKPDDDDTEDVAKEKEFNKRIAAHRKPYFFIFNYDHLYSRYKKFMRKADTSCQREFGCELKELLEKNNKTVEEIEFVEFYYKFLPIDEARCTVNRICWYIEDNVVLPELKNPEKVFNPALLKSPNKTYSEKQYYTVRPLLEKEYALYREELKKLAQQMNDEGIHGTERAKIVDNFGKTFELKINVICPDEKLRCDVLIDIAYKSNVSKRFVWDVCGRQIIRNLLLRHKGIVSYPVKSDTVYEFVFKGEKYQMVNAAVDEEAHGAD